MPSLHARAHAPTGYCPLKYDYAKAMRVLLSECEVAPDTWYMGSTVGNFMCARGTTEVKAVHTQSNIILFWFRFQVNSCQCQRLNNVCLRVAHRSFNLIRTLTIKLDSAKKFMNFYCVRETGREGRRWVYLRTVNGIYGKLLENRDLHLWLLCHSNGKGLSNKCQAIKMRSADERWDNRVLAAKLTDGFFLLALLIFVLNTCIHTGTRHVSRHVCRYGNGIGSANLFYLFHVFHYPRHRQHRPVKLFTPTSCSPSLSLASCRSFAYRSRITIINKIIEWNPVCAVMKWWLKWARILRTVHDTGSKRKIEAMM